MGRTTIIAKEKNTDKIAVIPVRILENSSIEPMVETSGSHTVMLKTDGTVWCYGINENGELGTADKKASDKPVKAVFPEGVTITYVACGEGHSLALDSEGNVWAWGKNSYYQLGNNTVDSYLVPTKIAELKEIRKIACGSYTSYAIGAQGEIYSFGLNANGEGGIGSYTGKISVIRAKNISGVIDIKAGKNHAVALRSTGEVYVTGSNLYGELGQKDSGIRRTKEFTKVQNLQNVVAIGAGDSTSLALKDIGEVYTWGSNIYKEQGIGSTDISVQEPSKIPNLSDIRYISGGKNYQAVINKSGEVFVCGQNACGELGNGSKTNVENYEKLSTIQEVIDIDCGNTYTVMVKKDGTVWGCGDYSHGDEDIKSKTKSSIPVQVGNDQTGLSDTEIVIEKGKTKDISSDCEYEFNLIYQNKNFADTLKYTSLKTEIATVDEKGVVTGQRTGITRVNAISNATGKTYSVLVKVVEESFSIAPKVDGGENFASVLKADGSIWSFGYNGAGQLGVGNYITQDIPTKIDVSSTYKDIKVGKDFMIALREDGTVWTVGNNKDGQLRKRRHKGKKQSRTSNRANKYRKNMCR